jgi:pimeloyl-ACP methyl ester carboxylesterase
MRRCDGSGGKRKQMTQRAAAVAALLLAACQPLPAADAGPGLAPRQEAEWRDPARHRGIPLALYGADPARPKRLAVLLPGYGLAHTEYEFLASALTRRGFVVAALQPQRADDPAVPTGANLAERRRPYWRRGAEDVRFAISRLREQRIARHDRVVVVGHSHGGDIALLLASEEPQLLAAVFTLDNRRMPFPRLRSPQLCSVRSSDMPADPGVLPTAEEQSALGMVIVRLDIRHDDMSDAAPASQQALMVAALDRCLMQARTPG